MLERKPFRSYNNVRLFVASEPCLHDKILTYFFFHRSPDNNNKIVMISRSFKFI